MPDGDSSRLGSNWLIDMLMWVGQKQMNEAWEKSNRVIGQSMMYRSTEGQL